MVTGRHKIVYFMQQHETKERIFKKGKEVLFVSYASKMFKLLRLTIGFNSREVIDEVFLSSLGRLITAEEYRQGLKGGGRQIRKVCSILFETRRQGKMAYLFIEAREKTGIFKTGSCKCDLI